MNELTGDMLLEQLQAMTPEQRRLPVVCQTHDVGRNRETINNSASGQIKLVNVNNDGEEDEDSPPNSIQILT